MQPIQPGTGDPSLSNIRPIYGHVSATATRCGKNLANVTIASGGTAPAITNNGDGTVTFDGTIGSGATIRYVATNINLTAGVTYALSGRPAGEEIPSTIWLALYPPDSTTLIAGTQDYGSGSTYTPDTDVTVRIGARFPANTEVSMTFSPMLRLANTSASFEAYNGDNYEVSFGQTVYGGTLDFVTGVLTATMAFVELTGTESYSGTTIISLSKSSVGGGKASGTIISDRFASRFSAGDNFGSIRLSGASIIQFSNSNLYFSDSAAFKAWVAEQYAAGTPVQLCYELDTPTTAQLDPQNITTLQGQNNIWATTETNEP